MRTVLLVLLLFVVSTATATADAASVAYVESGSVWLSSLDGAQKVRLASPVVNSSGETEEWLDVAQSDNGRIVAVRNKPGRIARFSWFKIWEPNGTSTVEGPLSAPSRWAIYVYPLGFDITADGSHIVYGYSNSGSCCPIPYSRGTYVRLATNNVLDPADLSGVTHPAVVGDRIVGLDDANTPSQVIVQNADGGNPLTETFTPWMDTTPVGLEPGGVDMAGSLVSIDFEAWTDGTQTTGKIAVIATQGLNQPPTLPGAIDCFVPAAGVARESSLSPDGSLLAWSDDGGVKIAGVPSTSADPCVMGSAPVVIAPAAPRAPARPAARTTGLGPVLTLPAKLTLKALRAKAGLALKVRVGGPGRVTASATVPAKRLGRRGKKAIVVATGSALARAAGSVTVRLKLNALGRKRARRLKGARLTVKITHAKRSTTKAITVR
jgi:hypothetical protein